VQEAALQATLDIANQAANAVSEVAWEQHVFRCHLLQRITYGQVRALGRKAQPAVRIRRTFRPDAAQPYDDRCLSWQPDQQTVSICTVAGRLKGPAVHLR
jgi:putative transposase